jgi:hypothetical protein
MNYNFKFIKNIEINSFIKKIESLKEQDWYEWTFRQESFDVHKNTLTIPLIFDDDYRMKNPTYHKHYFTFKDEMNYIEKIFKTHYGEGQILKSLLVNLKSNSSVLRHIDLDKSLVLAHRTHLPIITNKDVFFEINNEYKNLKSGELWEIDNSNKFHSVVNKSMFDRIHLIVDYLITK